MRWRCAVPLGVTLLYTPVFKRITAVKNACVAAVIAAAPLSGAVAAGAVRGHQSLNAYSELAVCFCPAVGLRQRLINS